MVLGGGKVGARGLWFVDHQNPRLPGLIRGPMMQLPGGQKARSHGTRGSCCTHPGMGGLSCLSQQGRRAGVPRSGGGPAWL